MYFSGSKWASWQGTLYDCFGCHSDWEGGDYWCLMDLEEGGGPVKCPIEAWRALRGRNCPALVNCKWPL